MKLQLVNDSGRVLESWELDGPFLIRESESRYGRDVGLRNLIAGFWRLYVKDEHERDDCETSQAAGARAT